MPVKIQCSLYLLVKNVHIFQIGTLEKMESSSLRTTQNISPKQKCPFTLNYILMQNSEGGLIFTPLVNTQIFLTYA